MNTEAVVALLDAWRGGDMSAYDRLIALVYNELRRLATAQLRRDPSGHSVQPTQLVHEAYLRLVKADVDWRNRTHFLSVAARVMRRILVEHARARQAQKRGGDDLHVTISEAAVATQSRVVEMLVLNDALDQLRDRDARQADVVELSYFGGLTHPEIGEALGISEATVERDLRHARAWLRRVLSTGG